MKRILAIVLTVAMLLSMSTVVVVAAGSEFEAVGEQQITWDPDATEKIELDGDISDWREANYSSVQVTLNNVVYFDNCTNQGFPDDWALNIYYVSDADNLYVAFSVVDADLQPIPAGTWHGNYVWYDCFQIAIDFNAQIERWETETPGYCEDLGASIENIFYSFSYAGDGTDLTFVRQNKIKDAVERLTANDGAWGKSGETENGWCAEFALSWDMLFSDFAYKTYGDGYTANVDPENPLQLGILLSCFDATSEGAAVSTGGNGVVGTFKTADGSVADGVTPMDNGLYLQLPWQRGLEINCDGITVSDEVGGGDDELPPEEKPGAINVLDKLSNFHERHNTQMATQDCTSSVTEDGVLRLTGWTKDEFNDPEQTDTVAHLDVLYSRLMNAFYTGFTATNAVEKMKELPNANVEDPYTVVALKVKRSESIRDQDVYMWYSMGNNSTPVIDSSCWADIGIPATDDGYEYFLFNLADYDDFQEDYINTLRFFWIDDQIGENTEGATMDVYAVNLYTSMDEAFADMNLTGIENSFGGEEEPSETETETESESEDDNKATTVDTNATDDSEEEGCGSVIGAGAAAVVLSAVAAAVVLKKKED